ncbi:N-acetylmuramoyl-L-alanine amidase [Flavobacteriaceae bacterium]|nr:N-acetylmuramoyl-L-alanine amidase [Flavobacteriaceae bacterium]
MRNFLLFLSWAFLISTLTGLTVEIQAQEKPFVVVLDAGHGGHDSGNRGNGYFEKKIALNIALKIGAQLEKDPRIKVIYTRKKDVFVDLIVRAEIANKADADLFVSIHCDAFTSSQAFGAGTFVLGLHENERNFKVAQKENSVIFLEENYEQKYDGFNPNDPQSVISLILMQETYLDQSIAAASSIQSSFVNNLQRKDRTVKQAGFVVLKYTYMPSVLVETGFLTNSSEGAFLNSSKGQNQMATAISKAIKNYKNQREAGVQNQVIAQVNPDPVSQSPQNTLDFVFKVQIAASKNRISTKPYNFNGLLPISREKNGKLYRYFYQSTLNYETAKDYLKTAKRKGYSNAFLVAFDGDKKITISEALQRLK